MARVWNRVQEPSTVRLVTLLTHGSIQARRGMIAAMRITATAGCRRDFAAPESDLVRAMADLLSHHRLDDGPIDLQDLVGDEDPWKDLDTALESIVESLDQPEDRREAAHAGFLVALMADDPDGDALRTARLIARALHADDQIAIDLEASATAEAKIAEADLFRRFLSWKTGVDLDTVVDRLQHELPVVETPTEVVEELRRRIGSSAAGTVGAELGNFYRDTGFDIPGSPGTLPLEVLGSHDVHHILTGYDAGPEDEVYLAVYTAANSRRGGTEYLAVIALQWHQGIRLGVFDPARAILDPVKMIEAARRGDETPVDLTELDWDWMALLDLPLEEARSNLGIPPGGSWIPGGRWDAGLREE